MSQPWPPRSPGGSGTEPSHPEGRTPRSVQGGLGAPTARISFEQARELVERDGVHDITRHSAGDEVYLELADGGVVTLAPAGSHGIVCSYTEPPADPGGPSVEERVSAIEQLLYEAADTLDWLADAHHSTLRRSLKHKPRHQDWTECECLTCKRAKRTFDRLRAALADAMPPEGRIGGELRS